MRSRTMFVDPCPRSGATFWPKSLARPVSMCPKLTDRSLEPVTSGRGLVLSFTKPRPILWTSTLTWDKPKITNSQISESINAHNLIDLITHEAENYYNDWGANQHCLNLSSGDLKKHINPRLMIYTMKVLLYFDHRHHMASLEPVKRFPGLSLMRISSPICGISGFPALA